MRIFVFYLLNTISTDRYHINYNEARTQKRQKYTGHLSSGVGAATAAPEFLVRYENRTGTDSCAAHVAWLLIAPIVGKCGSIHQLLLKSCTNNVTMVSQLTAIDTILMRMHPFIENEVQKQNLASVSAETNYGAASRHTFRVAGVAAESAAAP